MFTKKSSVIAIVVSLFFLISSTTGYTETAEAVYHPAGVYYGVNNKVPLITEYDLTDVELKKPLDSNREFDENIIPLFNYKDEDYYHPVLIAQFGLKEYSRFVISGDLSHLKNAFNAANWLVDNQDQYTGEWYYHFDFNVGGMGVTLEAPWSSAMAQGQALSLLSRVALFTSDPSKYLDAAERAMIPLTIPVEYGGQLAYFNGHPFFEEYPTLPYNFTLNGFIFALMGLYDFAELHDNSKALDLFEDGVNTLIYMLPFYDQGNISAYHLGHLTNPPRKVHSAARYHVVHINQLELLYSIRSNDTIKFYKDLWKTYKLDI